MLQQLLLQHKITLLKELMALLTLHHCGGFLVVGLGLKR
jgi:hypothetical protein